MYQQHDISLKAARVEKGFTQEALAEKLGVSKRALVNWENGEAEIKPMVIYAMAYVFQMDADFLRIPILK
ncbi:helix-turn-helix domain-containing protein [Bacillus sp. FSL K6-3431]|uniref:helix-turn-helix domain-containing protein n=1 Tax=Bacillus sp. FSL K6-3431 TaxID=2921500 RepID=UPI0030F9B667